MREQLVLTAFSPKMLRHEAIMKFKGPFEGQTALSLIRERAASLQPTGIGHPGAAHLLSVLLGRPVEVDRSPVTLNRGDRGLIVLAAGRLEPGSELTDEELRKLLVVYEFEVLE